MTSLTQQSLKEQLHYDPDTGDFTWVNDRQFGRVKAGSKAGALMPVGYRTMRVNGLNRYAHRLAFLYMTGEWPAGQVDHINTIKSDNRWSNLRVATASENQRNVGARTANKSGVKNVHWHESAGKWVGAMRVGGDPIYLGLFEKLDDAAQAVAKFRQQHHRDFARESY